MATVVWKHPQTGPPQVPTMWAGLATVCRLLTCVQFSFCRAVCTGILWQNWRVGITFPIIAEPLPYVFLDSLPSDRAVAHLPCLCPPGLAVQTMLRFVLSVHDSEAISVVCLLNADSASMWKLALGHIWFPEIPSQRILEIKEFGSIIKSYHLLALKWARLSGLQAGRNSRALKS